MLKFLAESDNVLNPIKITKALKEVVDKIESAKRMRDGRLLLLCHDKKQQKAAVGLKTLLGIKVSCTVMEERKWLKGVISEISTDVSVESIKRNLPGAVVVDAKRLKYAKNEQKVDSLSVMIQFDAEKLLEKVYLGYLSYVVRPYSPPPIRCFKCQKFGHVAAVCNGKLRCARYGGEHEYGKCGQGVNPKCYNCGENHSAGYGGCKVRKNGLKAQNIRISEGISYVEALMHVQKM